LQNAGVEVFLLNFVSAFFDSSRAIKSAAILNLQKNLIVENFTAPHLQIVKNPPSGWGKNLNPCVDCRALKLKIAEKIRAKKNCEILATGEVLGQRPFSQNKNAFARVEKITNLQNKILRPLSAQLLPPTDFEISGKISREKLEKISGRSRKSQLNLAKKFGIENFPTAAGGCILTDPKFAERGKKLLEISQNARAVDFQILKFGRFFVFENSAIILVGRNFAENLELKSRATAGDFLVKMKNAAGGTALVRFFDFANQKFQNEKLPRPACRQAGIPDKIFSKNFSGMTNVLNFAAGKVREFSKFKNEAVEFEFEKV